MRLQTQKELKIACDWMNDISPMSYEGYASQLSKLAGQTESPRTLQELANIVIYISDKY